MGDKMEKIYNFRDPKNLLKNIDKGKRSIFIRDAIESKINIAKQAYPPELEIKKLMITTYTKNIQDIDEYLSILENEKEDIKKTKQEIQSKLDESTNEYHRIKQLFETENKILDKNKKKEFEIIKKVVILIIKSRHDENIEINLEYYEYHGNFKSRKYFKESLLEFINENIKTGDIIDGEYISQDDIEYMKDIIMEYD